MVLPEPLAPATRSASPALTSRSQWASAQLRWKRRPNRWARIARPPLVVMSPGQASTARSGHAPWRSRCRGTAVRLAGGARLECEARLARRRMMRTHLVRSLLTRGHRRRSRRRLLLDRPRREVRSRASPGGAASDLAGRRRRTSPWPASRRRRSSCCWSIGSSTSRSRSAASLRRPRRRAARRARRDAGAGARPARAADARRARDRRRSAGPARARRSRWDARCQASLDAARCLLLDGDDEVAAWACHGLARAGASLDRVVARARRAAARSTAGAAPSRPPPSSPPAQGRGHARGDRARRAHRRRSRGCDGARCWRWSSPRARRSDRCSRACSPTATRWCARWRRRAWRGRRRPTISRRCARPAATATSAPRSPAVDAGAAIVRAGRAAPPAAWRATLLERMGDPRPADARRRHHGGRRLAARSRARGGARDSRLASGRVRRARARHRRPGRGPRRPPPATSWSRRPVIPTRWSAPRRPVPPARSKRSSCSIGSPPTTRLWCARPRSRRRARARGAPASGPLHALPRRSRDRRARGGARSVWPRRRWCRSSRSSTPSPRTSAHRPSSRWRAWPPCARAPSRRATERGSIVAALEGLAEVGTYPVRIGAADAVDRSAGRVPPIGTATTARTPGDYRSMVGADSRAAMGPPRDQPRRRRPAPRSARGSAPVDRVPQAGGAGLLRRHPGLPRRPRAPPRGGRPRRRRPGRPRLHPARRAEPAAARARAPSAWCGPRPMRRAAGSSSSSASAPQARAR